MVSELIGTDLKELIREQKEIYANGMRKKIADDFNQRPILVVDDPTLNKVLMMSLKLSPDLAKTEKSENAMFTSNYRIMPFNPQQYYILIGEKYDLNYPLSTHSPDHGSLPMAAIEHEAVRHIVKTKGACSPGNQLAEVMSHYLSDPVVDAYPSGSRPRAIQAVLVSNPAAAYRLPKERYPDTKIYIMERTRFGDSLVISAMTGTVKDPAHYASDITLWEDYQESLQLIHKENHVKGSQRRKKNILTLDDKMTAGIAALMAHVNNVSYSLIDAVTVPFELPEGNKSHARYDFEYIKPLFARAEKLRSTMTK